MLLKRLLLEEIHEFVMYGGVKQSLSVFKENPDNEKA